MDADLTDTEKWKHMKRSLTCKGWKAIKYYRTKSDHECLEVITKDEDDEELHNWRVYWGFSAFARHAKTRALILFYTM